ncbi:MAG: hypothetical protein J0H57_24705, partial [Rhodospirillales bacterium]|nr:hypothetical protein [Rhodospirillales bacterium]
MSVTTSDDLLKLSQAELDALFSAHDPGPIPNGEAKGTAIVAPGTTFNAGTTDGMPHPSPIYIVDVAASHNACEA